MTESRDVLLKLVRYAMGWETDFSLPDDINWLDVIKLSKEQAVSAIAIDGYHNLLLHNKGIRSFLNPQVNPQLFTLCMQNLYSVEQNFLRQQLALQKLSAILSSHNISFLLFKGFACARYYPQPNHRECGDIDIYPGTLFDNSNEALREANVCVQSHYYRHSTSTIDGVLIENHRVLGDLRSLKESKKFDTLLRYYANKCLNQQKDEDKSKAVVYPSAMFNALFLPWHVSAHFAFEKVTLRHLLDWALFLSSEGDKIDMAKLGKIKQDYTHGYSQFVDILTALSIKHFHIPISKIPEELIVNAQKVDECLLEKVWNYFFIGTPRERDNNIWIFRWNNMKRIWQERWKYKEIYSMNVASFYLQKTAGVLFRIGEIK